MTSRNRFISNYATVVTLFFLGFGCQSPNQSKVSSSADTLASDTVVSSNSSVDENKKQLEIQSIAFLQEKFKNDIKTGVLDSTSKRFVVAEYDLNQDGKKEIFLGLSGSYFCGSGGCTVLLLDSDKKLLNTFTVVDYPLAIAETATKGWKDLVMNSNGKFHLVKFNGTKYPSNPSVQAVIEFSNQSHEIILNPNEQTKWFQF